MTLVLQEGQDTEGGLVSEASAAQTEDGVGSLGQAAPPLVVEGGRVSSAFDLHITTPTTRTTPT